jgi:hypothetical protein
MARKRVTDVVQSYVIICPCLCNYISYSAIISRVYVIVIFRYVLLRYSSMCIMVQLVVVWGLLYYIACFYYIVVVLLSCLDAWCVVYDRVTGPHILFRFRLRFNPDTSITKLRFYTVLCSRND